MFEVGDAVVHPVRGAGVVTGFEELRRSGSVRRYYTIELLSQASTSLMIPVKGAETRGLRRAIPQSKLSQVWRVLYATPEKLPSDRKARYRLVEGKLKSGDVIQVTEVVRDMAWWRRLEDGFSTREKRIFQRGMALLAGEIAATQGVGLPDAEAQVRDKLDESPSLGAGA
ncbi:MAG: CarD family transcriptional regulator [Anaerolineae bacterium]